MEGHEKPDKTPHPKNRRVRWLLLALGGLLALGVGFVAFTELRQPPQDEASKHRLAPPPKLVGFSLGKDLEETARLVDAPYQLAVDRRFRFARRFVQAGKLDRPAEWTQEFPDGQAFDPVRPFPELLSFAGAFAELGGVAAREGEGAHAQVTAEEQPEAWIVSPKEALKVIHQQALVGKLVKKRAAARAVISLLFSMPDRLETADEIGGLALALLAQAEQEELRQLTPERAVLSRLLGYTTRSSELAEQLSPGGFRAYLTFDDRGLLAAAQSDWGRRLWTRRQLELGKPEGGRALLSVPPKERVSFSTVGLQTAATGFDEMRLSAQECPLLIELLTAELAGLDVQPLIDRLAAAPTPGARRVVGGEIRVALIARNAEASGLSLDALSYLGRMERLLGLLEKLPGAPLAREVTQKYIISQVCSCMHAYVHFRFDLLSTNPKERARDVQEMFDSEQPVFSQLKRWLELRALAHAQRRNTARIISTAAELDGLGAGAHRLLVDDLAENINYSDPVAREVARYLAGHLDSRPRHLISAANELAPLVFDKRYKEFFARAFTKEAAKLGPYLSEWWERYSNREAETKEADAKDDGLRESNLRSKLDESRDDWQERQRLTRLLHGEGRDEEIPAIVEPWFERHPNADGFALEWALSNLAEVELSRGKPDLAARILQPIWGSYKFSTINLATRIALAQKDYGQATFLSRRGLSRYPTSAGALALRLKVAWLGRQSEDVKEVIGGMTKQPTLVGLDPVADALVEAFEDRPPEEAKAAAQTLFASGVEVSLTEVIAGRFAKRKRFEHCAKMLEIPVGSWLHQLSNDVESYRCRREISGKEEARKWLEQRVPAKAREPMIMFAYQHAVDELIFEMDFPFEEEKSRAGDYLWAMRAASARRHFEGRSLPTKIVDHYKGETDVAGYAAIGRFLVGALDRRILIEAAKDNRSVNEIAYYLGLDAEVHGRIGEAFVWYRASVETNERKSAEWRYAKNSLYRLNRSKVPLAEQQPVRGG